MIRRPPRSTPKPSSAASDVYKRQYPFAAALLPWWLCFCCAGLELSQDPRELYVLKTTKWRLPPRLVLNARRPVFDLQEDVRQSEVDPQQQPRKQEPWELSARALRSAFKVHAELGNKGLVRESKTVMLIFSPMSHLYHICKRIRRRFCHALCRTHSPRCLLYTSPSPRD